MKIDEMISVNRADCSGCEACANICPKKAITMTRDAEGFAYPKIDSERCIKCGRCDAICPALNFKAKTLDAFPKTFAAVNPDEKIRRHSSSGGVFTALSEIILRGGGVVFGAAFDENWHVFHKAARTLDELENLRGSKYVQSRIGDVYRQVKAALKSTSVLFSGTPCQCAGLRAFLGKDYDNLLTVDLICYGVPSPAVWEYYIGELGYSHDIAHFNFKNKLNGWQNPHIAINFYDQGYYLRPLGQELYGKLFLGGLSDRPSCQICKFKFPNARSDLTIGDAWGVQKFAPQMFDNRGTSLVIVHTAKGAKFLEQTKLLAMKIKFSDAVMSNPSTVIPATADARRGNFFAHFANIADKLAVMQYYGYQDDSAARKKIGEQNQRALAQRWQALAAQVRGKFAQRILVITAPLADNAGKFLEAFLESKLPNCGIYIVKPDGNGLITCTETFSSLTFPLKDFAALAAVAKQLHFAGVLVENTVNLQSGALADWLKTCGLPVNVFSRNTGKSSGY